MYCTNCGKEINDNAKFCTFCGAAMQTAGTNKPVNAVNTQKQPKAAGTRAANIPLPDGITIDENGAYIWESEMPASQCKPLFTVFHIVIAILALIPLAIVFFVNIENGIKDTLVYMGITVAIAVFADIICVICVMGVRGGIYRAKCRLGDEDISSCEQMRQSKNILWAILRIIVEFSMIDAASETMLDPDPEIVCVTKYKDIRSITSKCGKRIIMLKKSVVSDFYITEPHYHDFVIGLIKEKISEQRF